MNPCRCGCGQMTEYTWRRGHHMYSHPTWQERFWSKVDKSGDCWEWTAYRDRDGYGKFGLDGAVRGAHRVAYTLVVAPIPAGQEIDHLCRNRGCVNPSHLEPVTKITNNQRGQSPPAINARKTFCSNGHEFTAENTYIRPNGARTCRECNRISVLRYKERSKVGSRA